MIDLLNLKGNETLGDLADTNGNDDFSGYVTDPFNTKVALSGAQLASFARMALAAGVLRPNGGTNPNSDRSVLMTVDRNTTWSTNVLAALRAHWGVTGARASFTIMERASQVAFDAIPGDRALTTAERESRTRWLQRLTIPGDRFGEGQAALDARIESLPSTIVQMLVQSVLSGRDHGSWNIAVSDLHGFGLQFAYRPRDGAVTATDEVELEEDPFAGTHQLSGEPETKSKSKVKGAYGEEEFPT